MEAETRNQDAGAASEQPASGQDSVPGTMDSAILVIDSLLTLLRLVKLEAALALGSLPGVIQLNLYRIPAYLLTWLSFCVLAACAVHAFTDNVLLSVGTFFLLQLGLTLLLESRLHKLNEQLSFPQSRKGFSMLQASIGERFGNQEQP